MITGRTHYTVKYGDRSYLVAVDENTTLETVWNSQKGWFSQGCEVTVEDDKGNRKTFRKE